MKNWILKKFFKKELKEATRQGSIDAFEKARKDLEETNIYNTEEKAKELMTKQLNDLLSLRDFKKIVTLDKNKGIIFIGGEKATDNRLINLKAEAEFFLQSDLWQIICESVKRSAEISMFVSGESLEDMRKGRSILYTLSSQNNILQTFKSYVGNKTTNTMVK